MEFQRSNRRPISQGARSELPDVKRLYPQANSGYATLIILASHTVVAFLYNTNIYVFALVPLESEKSILNDPAI